MIRCSKVNYIIVIRRNFKTNIWLLNWGQFYMRNNWSNFKGDKFM